MRVLFLIVLSLLKSELNAYQASESLKLATGGLTLSHDGKSYEITTVECPGGIFFTRPVNETCLCYNGIFAVVRDCCSASNERGKITTETLEWRKNFQCGMSPEIGDPEGENIKAILPLTKAKSPFQPLLTFKEFSGEDFTKWRKFDLQMLSLSPTPISFASTNQVEIINLRPLSTELRFRMGKHGDVDICYKGWEAQVPQTLKISIYTYSKSRRQKEYCCFEIRQENAPGIITSPCRGGSILTEMTDIESLNSGNSCPNQGNSPKATKLYKSNLSPIYQDLKRFKRQSEDQNPLTKEAPAPETLSDPSEPQPSFAPRFSLDELNKETLDQQHKRLRSLTMMRKKGNVTREPSTQRFKLLKKSLQIFQNQVSDEMVPKSLGDDAFEAFFYLYEALDSFEEDRLEEKDFQKIISTLDKCLYNHRSFKDTINLIAWPESCPLVHYKMNYTDNVTKNGENGETEPKIVEIPIPQIPRALRYDRARFDIIVEFNWKLIDFVQTICFEDFQEDYTSHHLYVTHLELLFYQKFIQHRWFRLINPNDNYAKGIIGYLERDDRMHEMDKTLGIAHSKSFSKYKYYLERPMFKLLRSQDPMFKRVDHYEDTISEYLIAFELQQQYDGKIDENSIMQTIQIKPDGVSGPVKTVDQDLSDGDPLQRKKKHVSNIVNKKQSNNLEIVETHSLARPGDIIWDGLAVCLDTGNNDDPAYYSQEELWGTKPSLLELGKRFPWGK